MRYGVASPAIDGALSVSDMSCMAQKSVYKGIWEVKRGRCVYNVFGLYLHFITSAPDTALHEVDLLASGWGK